MMNNNPLDIRHSYIVQAPAGSGKTCLLTQRLLALLAEAVESPEECLCITFTRKAAAEMRNRVMQALSFAYNENENLGDQKHLEDQKDSENQKQKQIGEHEKITLNLAQQVLKRSQQLDWNLLKNPNRLQIQTIDALCANLAQRMPVTSGLGGHISIIEDAEAIYLDAASQLLQRLEKYSFKHKKEKEDNEEENQEKDIFDALNCLLKHCDNDWEAVAQLLAEMLKKRDQWLLALGGTLFTIPNRTQLEQGLVHCIEETLSFAKSMFNNNSILKELTQELFVLVHFASQYSEDIEIKSRIENLRDWPEVSLSDLPKWKALADVLLTDDDEWRKIVSQKQGFPAATSTKNAEEKKLFKTMKERMQTLLFKFNEFPDFKLALQYIRDCPPPCYTEEQWILLKALMTVLPQLVAELLFIFQKSNQVDFIEIALRAHQSLGDKNAPSDLSLQLGNQYRHILVDEFQDTSISQYLLLEKLTMTLSEYEGNTLFFVGDPMQSIYRFRRAEVSLFIEAKRRGMNDIKLTPITLIKNYRSKQKIISWVNDTFSKLFPKTEDYVLGAIPYVACEGSDVACEGNEIDEEINQSEVVLQTVTEEDEHEKIINCIKQCQEKNPTGSIAILVRSRSHLKSLIPALTRENIVFQGLELDVLESRPIIRDLIALTRSLIHLSDRIAWLSLLRTPYANIELQDIEIIANYKPSLPIFLSMKEFQKISNLSENTKINLAKILPILNEAIDNRERVPLVNLVKKTWKQLMETIEYKNFNSQELSLMETYFAFCRELAQKEDLYNVGLLEEKIHNQYISTNVIPLSIKDSKQVPLQIMTIHKAKGLEFDTVILPGLGRREMFDQTQLLLWEERRLANGKPYLILGPLKSAKIKKDPIYEYLRKQVRKRSEFENLRLLYVAATRAKKRLYGFMHHEFII